MTCMGCQKFVKKQIEALKEVNFVEVNLESGLVKVHSNKTLSLKDIEKCLGTKYSILNVEFSRKTEIEESKIKKLRPLFLIFIYLIAGTFFLVYQLETTPQRGMQIFMGLFFVVFSLFKFLDYQEFPNLFKRYDPLAKRIPGYAKLYPFLETALGSAFLFEWQLPLVLLLTLVILSFTTYGVIRVLIQKSEIECVCLGTALKLPMTEATLIENGIMLTMSSMLLIGYII